MQTKYLILGAGPAGASAIRGIRKEDDQGKIVIVGDEPYRTYSLPLLTKGYIQGRFREDGIYLVGEDFYEKNGATFLKERRAVNVEPEDNLAALDDGTEIHYEKLLVSTGGRPRKFNIPGSGLKGIYYLRTLDDANEIIKAAGNVKEAVVIGGSFIGVELAVALREIGLTVKLVMLERYVWESLLPESVGNYLMEKLLEGRIQIFPEEKVIWFEGENEWVRKVKTESGKTFKSDFVCVGIGLILNTDFLKGTAIVLNQGVLVNEFLETNIKGIYAAGDVAEFNDLILGKNHLVGHIENANLQGQVAGRNMVGAEIQYAEVTGYDSEIFGEPLIFIGALEYGSEHWIRGKQGESPIGSFSLRDGRIVGTFFLKPKGKEIRAVRELLKNRDVDIRKYEDELKDPETDLATFVKSIKG
ncbi:MAG TPA: FAD-dependent oxidoreductase [Thermodesulfobacteriota bacterium]|nr:FAD-dependent oxidoreductase [Thermodesulfobacteriota bacterium]